MQAEDIKRLIEEGLPGSRAIVRGDDGQHFEAIVESSLFAGKTTLEQHRMVYALLGNRFQTDALHALSLKTRLPEDGSN